MFIEYKNFYNPVGQIIIEPKHNVYEDIKYILDQSDLNPDKEDAYSNDLLMKYREVYKTVAAKITDEEAAGIVISLPDLNTLMFYNSFFEHRNFNQECQIEKLTSEVAGFQKEIDQLKENKKLASENIESYTVRNTREVNKVNINKTEVASVKINDVLDTSNKNPVNISDSQKELHSLVVNADNKISAMQLQLCELETRIKSMHQNLEDSPIISTSANTTTTFTNTILNKIKDSSEKTSIEIKKFVRKLNLSKIKTGYRIPLLTFKDTPTQYNNMYNNFPNTVSPTFNRMIQNCGTIDVR
jgi:hypothetical protein